MAKDEPSVSTITKKQLRVAIYPKLHERNHPIPTYLHVYVLGGRGSRLRTEVDELEIKNAAAIERFKYDLGTASLPATSVLAVDCFMEEHNRHGVSCKQRVGSVSFSLRELYNVGERGVRLALHHDSSRLEQGHITCVATFEGVSVESFAPPASAYEWTSETQEQIEGAIEAYVRKEMAPFHLKQWIPAHPFLQRVHAPLH